MRNPLMVLLLSGGLLVTTLSYAQCPKSSQQLQAYEASLQRQEVQNDPAHAGQIDQVLVEMSMGQEDAVQADIKAGLSPNATVQTTAIGPKLARSISPLSLLTVAVDMCQTQIAEDLVELGASANGDRGDDTGGPLNEAAGNGDATLVDFLIKHGAVVDKSDIMGNSPLANAVLQNKKAAVSVLLKNGANPNRPSGTGETILSIASRNPDQSIANELMTYGGKR